MIHREWNEKILVTGGCGFIGSNFVRLVLQSLPACRVVNLDKLTRCIAWNDAELGILWPISAPILSGKDATNAATLLHADCFV